MKKKICIALAGIFLFLAGIMPVSAAESDKIVIPDGYINASDKISVETGEDGSRELVSIRVKLDHGAYRDITDSKCFSVSNDCTAYVKIRYKLKDGSEETVELSEEITTFDNTPPSINAYIKGESLIIKVTDDKSGARTVTVDGRDYTDLNDDSLGINLKELENTKEYLIITATDKAGNKTNILKINNPYYVGEESKNSTDKSTDNPQSVNQTYPTSASGLITSHTDENGEDLMNVSYKEFRDADSLTSGGSKQFFTVKTKSDKVFYIVVDESYGQQTAYLLTEAGENDLLNFVNYDGNSIDTGKTDIYTVSDNEKSITKQDTSESPATEKKEKKSSLPAIIILTALIGAGAYFVKFKKKKDDDEDEDEFEDMDEDDADE